MDRLPEGNELFEMSRRGIQNLSNIGAFSVCGPDRIASISKSDVVIGSQINDRLRLGEKAVNVPRRVVVGISNESDAIEGKRTHG
jgi:hypothetical protein